MYPGGIFWRTISNPISLWLCSSDAHHFSTASYNIIPHSGFGLKASRCKVIIIITVLAKSDKTRAGTVNTHFTSNLHVMCGWYVLGTALDYIQVVQQTALSSLIWTVSFHWHIYILTQISSTNYYISSLLWCQ